MTETATAPPTCPECGAPVPRTAPGGLCLRCVVRRTCAVPWEPAPTAGFAPPAPAELEGQFPDLEVRELLGRGGMGAVYSAGQRSLDREVALKLLPAELLGQEDFVDRFQREAQALARFDHPNLARVFDAGITDSGRPYIVMELIRGPVLTRYCTNRQLDTRGRLKLFLQVCAGVQHAHQKGIIHRDLKPSNVLVGDTGGGPTPKVIDFGLAKPLADTRGDDTGWLSRIHAVGTPAYLSPEQAAGGDIDTRSDIYSLGVLLYELLTDRTPFDETPLHNASRSVIERTVCHTPIARPSEVVGPGPGSSSHRGGNDVETQLAGQMAERAIEPGASQRELRGDLDAIVLKALAKDPAGRYATVEALADDIERHLKGLPVIAVTPTPRYRLGKFLRRHRVGVLAAVGGVALLLFAIGLILRESWSTARAEKLAEIRLRQGERLIEFMMGDLQGRLTELGRLDVLESAVTEAEKFYGDPGVAAFTPESLANRARARLALGRVRNAQGKADVAKGHYDEAIRLGRLAIAAQPDQLEWQEQLIQTWNSVAVVHHASRDFAAAEAGYREALRLNADSLARDPHNAGWIDTRASLLHNLAALCEATGRLDEAERCYQESLNLWLTLLQRLPDNPEILDHLAELHQNVAFVHGRRRDPGGAAKSNAEALRLRERLLQLDPQNMTRVEKLADIEQNIADIHLKQGQIAEAAAWLDRYFPRREQLASRDPANAWWQQRLADALRNRAIVQVQQGHEAEAAAGLRRAWEISEQALTHSDAAPGWRDQWIQGLKNAEEVFARLARTEEAAGHTDLAQAHEQTVRDIQRKLLGAGTVKSDAGK